jgi:transcriptional regulator of heat shock response
MQDKINPNIRSIIHILNNWNFTYDGSYVRANLEIHITKDELVEIKDALKTELANKTNSEISTITDEEKNQYQEAIFDLAFAIEELEKSNGLNI